MTLTLDSLRQKAQSGEIDGTIRFYSTEKLEAGEKVDLTYGG